ncbi:MAG TPA: cyclic nucleotide-gated ion channel, partial [Steroidobacteraceae bacterium]|nr:cyclic nucleotide-gated ion channel [Steroidobacteraceae bacterium]
FASELAVKLWLGLRSKSDSNYPLSAAGAVDVLAVLPIPVALMLNVPAETAWLFASLWPLKLAATIPGFSLLRRVVILEARPLASVLFIFLIVLLLAGVALHVLERAGQPQRFGSLPMSLWWAVTTLTTTGYGDSVPQSFLGRLIAGMVMICGLGVFGLLTGILTTGFTAEHRRRDFIRNWDMVTRVPFLRNLDPAAMIELTRLLRRIDVAERTVMVRRGRPGDCMYFIASGEVEVKLEPLPIRLGAGSFFGEFALLDNSPRSATVVTTLPSTLLILDVSDFRTFTAQHPDLARAVAHEAARRASNNKNKAAGRRKKPLQSGRRPD